MRRNVLIFGLLLALGGGLALVGSCGDDAEVVARQVRDYIQNVRSSDGLASGALVEGTPPEPSGGPEADVDVGSATVLTGGGQSVEVSSDVPFAQIILAIDGADDYFEVDLPAPVGSADIILAVSQDVPDPSFSFEFAVVDEAGLVGAFVGREVAVEESPDSEVQVTLSWSNGANLNLQVLDPAGGIINQETPTTESGGSLNRNANADCESTENPSETVTWSGQAPTGQYQVDVFLEDGCGLIEADFVLVISRAGQDVIIETSSLESVLTGTPAYTTSFTYTRGGGGGEVTACGDGECSGDMGESVETCPVDCRGEDPEPVCGNDSCDPGEDAESCPEDCRTGAAVCGDSFCTEEVGETCSTCEEDCGSCDACSIEGAWAGTWSTDGAGASGSLSADLLQEGTRITGTGSLVVDSCPVGAETMCEDIEGQDVPLSGTFDGTNVQITSNDFQFEGTAQEGCLFMSGDWTSSDLQGTWSMNRADTPR